MILLQIVLFVALLSGINTFKLSRKDNAMLQETCGQDMREVQKYGRKVLNGTAAKGGESPWTAALYLVDYNGKTVYSTGTIISKRHILTYDNLVVQNTTKGYRLRYNIDKVLGGEGQECEGHDLVLSKEAVRRVTVYLDMLRADRFESQNMLQLKKITILGGCKTPYTMNKVTVLELIKDITEEDRAKPICLTAKPANSSLTFYGYGDNRGEVLDATLRHTNITIVPCEEPVVDDIFCVKSEHPLCNGDFGGGAVHRVGNTVINAYGIYMDGPYECAKANASTIYKFANLTSSSIRRSVCGATGVCDPTQTNDESLASRTVGANGEGADGTCTKGVKNYGVCSEVPDDGDLHIHIKLGLFKITKNPDDIEIVRRIGGSKSWSKKL